MNNIRRSKGFTISEVIVAVAAIGVVTMVVAIAYAAIHFILKFW